MYIAMNRFIVISGEEVNFEKVWRSRESRLDKVPGFREFNLLKGPSVDGGILYASHTVWENFSFFEAWTKSEHFRQAHANAGDNRSMYQGHPKFEGFEVVV